jgi:hypothetical protein
MVGERGLDRRGLGLELGLETRGHGSILTVHDTECRIRYQRVTPG